MTAKRNVIVSGAVAAIVAIALISAALLSPGLLGNSSATAQTGTLAVMLTDPPTVPTGTSAVYATYNDIAVHVSHAGNESGWYKVNTTGTINLMSVINISQTIATSKIPSGTYNVLRFNITSAIVTYNGKNYTALLVEDSNGASRLTVPIIGGLNVQSGSSAAAVIDLTPTILLLGNSSNPTFAFIGAARAYTMPANSISRGEIQLGNREDLGAQGWWEQIEHSAHFQITAASLSSNSLSITVKDTGNTSIVFRMAAVTSTTSQAGGTARESTDSTVAATSAFFVVEPNQSLAFVNASSRMQFAEMVAAGGYLLAPGASVTFTYSGPITIGLFAQSQFNMGGPMQGSTTTQTIVSGQHYVITLRADGMMAQTAVVAS